MSNYIDDTGRSILAQLSGKKSLASRFSLLFGILIPVILCLVLSWNISGRQNLSFWKTSEQNVVASKFVSLPATSGSPSSVIIVRPGTNKQDDLFLCRSGPITDCTNLTQSPVIQEVWPVLNTSGDSVAYYGIKDSSTELYLLALPDGIGTPITVRAGQSGLHTDYEVAPLLPAAFSPDGRWIAFSARSKSDNAVVIFVVDTSGQAVLPVKNWIGDALDYRWLDAETLIVALNYSSQKQDYKMVHYHSGSFYLGEIP